MKTHDLVITGADVIDGTGVPRFEADVAVDGDTIVSIGATGSLQGRVALAADGMILAPGFIDIHSHADLALLVDGRAQSAIVQGVTTIVTGNCGMGVAPTNTMSFGEFLQRLRDQGQGANVIPLIPHGAVRAMVAGLEARALTAQEVTALQNEVAKAMAQGGVGLSTGLEYMPGLAADTSELAALAEPVGELGGLYASHCRDRSDRIVDAAQEALTVCAQSGCRLQLSHFVRRPTGPGRQLADAARDLVLDELGDRARFDVFPFDYGPTPLSFLLPPWLHEGDRSDIASQLADTEARARVLDGLAPRFVEMVASGIAGEMVISLDPTGSALGRTLGDVADERGRSVAETAVDLLAEAGEQYAELVVCERWADWDDLVAAMADENFLLMGDGSYAGLDGPLAGSAVSLSDWGWAPACLGRFVRDLGLVPLETMIARMTSASADQLAMADRGRIAPGMRADLVVFDPATVGARVSPTAMSEPPTGVRDVLVNGEFALRAGQLTDARAGRVGRPT